MSSSYVLDRLYMFAISNGHTCRASSQASGSRKSTAIVKQAHNEANKGLLSASKPSKQSSHVHSILQGAWPLRTILPKGEDLYAYIGSKKKSLPENILYIATVDPIPSAVIKDWEATNASKLGINLRHGDDQNALDCKCVSTMNKSCNNKPKQSLMASILDLQSRKLVRGRATCSEASNDDLTDTDHELDEDAPSTSKVLDARSSFSDDPVLKKFLLISIIVIHSITL
ncbi:hypothetical protein IMY05_C4472000300 [Salix suchowensis]|nr:hypothetical protein IMY05_C4472000300 [Salix suchowensis]